MPTTTTLEIHPAIGIARLGSSQEFFLGPEPGLPIETNRRDATPDKLLKRQAARFRVYSCDRDERGTLVSFEELTPLKATVTWTVHLVNRKAAAPRFLTHLQVPNTNPALRRNGATGDDDDPLDKSLIIDGGTLTLAGRLQPARTFQGRFKGHDLPKGLGEISTDNDGRLVVLGGFGVSRSFPRTSINDFADNDNWHDDTSDGPVEATVHFLDGRPDKAVDRPAWVIACQPDFAPGIGNLVTLHDALIDIAISRGVLPTPTFRPAYDRDVLPLLNRVMAYQWVNRFARDAHRRGGKGDFAKIPNLGDPTTFVLDRLTIFGFLRDPDDPTITPEPPAMPALFSDDYFTDPTLVLTLTRSQYRILEEWARSEFDAIGPVQTELLPDALTRVALDACVGASFCPGIEAGRKLRDTTIYAAGEVFRFDRGQLKPGELTESMAVPWQADFSDCRWEASATPNPLAPQHGRGWWPAQRPDDVLRHPDDVAMSGWDRKADNKVLMVRFWDQLGVVLETKDAAGGTVFIETQRTLPE